MGKIKYLIFIFTGLFIFLLGTQKVWATTSDPEPGSGSGVVINEVMWSGSNNDSADEWLELRNMTDEPIDFTVTPWSLYKNDSRMVVINQGILDSYGFYLISRKSTGSILEVTPDLISSSLILNNRNVQYKLYDFLDNTGQLIDIADDGAGAPLAGSNTVPKASMERNDIPDDGTMAENWHTATDSVGFIPDATEKGTPGSENSQVVIQPPVNCPVEVSELVNCKDALIYTVQVSSITDGDTIKVSGLPTIFSSTIRFLFVDTPEEGLSFYEAAKDFTEQLLDQTVDLIISQETDEQKDRYGRTLAVIIFEDEVFNTQLLKQGLASFYDTDNSVLQKDAWLEILQQAQQGGVGLWASAGSIFISELLPNPVGSDAQGEWVEIYNPSSNVVDISYFLLDRYLIPSGTLITPKSFLVFHRTQTGITLNNTGDTVKLFFPGGLLADEVSYGKAKEGLSWAFADGNWQWTTTLTPGKSNIITSEDSEEVDGDDDEILDAPINSTPIEIKTGDHQNYENYLVIITGTVVQTSGNTFYIDDGSGRVKVYIQTATGIDKPEMHKGDIFQIIGIVNFYRGAWRILPRFQEDVKLIQKAQKEASGSVSSKTTAKKTSTSSKSTASTAKSRSPTSSKIASKDKIGLAQDLASIQTGGYKSPLWVEVVKALTGLTVVMLIILILKLRRLRQENPPAGGPLGGGFGDDYT